MNLPRVAPIAATLLALGVAASLGAQDKPAPDNKHGYTVTVELKVDDQGKPQKEQIVASDDQTPDHVLDAMALVMAAKTSFPPQLKDGKAVPFSVRAPFFFPIEDDEGAAADNVPKPKLKQAVQPVYPPELRDRNVVGGAIFEIVVDAEGKLASMRTMRASNPEFEAAAVESVKKWEFAPAEKDGKPVESRVRLAIVFETEDNKPDLKWSVTPRPSLGSFIVMKPSHPLPAAPASPATAEPKVPAALAPEPGSATPAQTPAAAPADKAEAGK
jgi:protein TonB